MKAARSLGWFLLAGLLGLAVDVVVLYAVAPLLGWYAARVLSFLAAATVTWRLNRRLAFADAAPHASPWREYLAYLSAMLGGAAVNYAIYVLVLHALSGP
ncbi:MAG: GtrA family protein, partial [Comamonadaceae bacterium]